MMPRNWRSGHKVMDSTEIESRFSNEDGMAFMDATVNDELTEESQEKFERVRVITEMLPPREADFVDLYYFRRLKQTAIAEIFNVSQPTVCYRLQRAAARIKFLLTMPEVPTEEVAAALGQALTNPMDIEIMILMYRTTCQSEVAKRLGVSQGLVRHRFMRSVGRMERMGGYEKYVDLFRLIAANLNILREVQKPWGDEKTTYIIG